MQTLWQDVRYAVRMLKKNPGFTAVAVLTLVLGIGANTAIFSIVNGFILRPLPVRAPEQLTVLATRQESSDGGISSFSYQFSYPAFVDFRQQADRFSDLFAFRIDLGGLSAGGKAEEFLFSYVSGNYFSGLGLRPAAGRLFLLGEGEKPGAGSTVVLAYAYWQRRFGGDPGVVGKQVLLNGRTVTIIGVAPKDFHGTYSVMDMNGYVPLSMAALEDREWLWTDRTARNLTVLGRLKPDATLAQAQSSVNIIATRLADQYPDTDKAISVRVIPERFARPQPYPTNIVPVIAALFLGLAGLVLLLACMNVANILLVRATARRHEMAIRSALGANRGRLMRQLLTETILLGLLGGAGGLILAEWSNSFGGPIPLTSSIPIFLDFSFDGRVFACALAAALFAGIFAGVLPALRAARANVNTVLHEGGRSDSMGVGRHTVRNGLVVAQVAGSLVLLIVAGLFVRSLQNAQQMYLGFERDHLLNVIMDTHEIGYDTMRAKEFYRQLRDKIRALPGVESTSLAYSVPMGYYNDGRSIHAEGHPPPTPGQRPPTALMNSIDPSYLETMRIPLLRGRAFRDTDNESSPKVAIVNQTMASQLWANEDAIGKRFRMGDSKELWEVVGITANGKYAFIAEPALAFFYVPLEQNFTSQRVLEIRSFAPPETLLAQVQEQIHALAPDLPISNAETMEQALQNSGNAFVLFHLGASYAAQMGFLGLMLAVVGVYGVVSFAASQRTHEIGIRMALGASPIDILRLVLRQGVRLVITGTLVGLGGTWALTRAVASLFVGTSPADPTTYLVVTILLSGIALLACYIPARRAMGVDPIVALRYE